MFHRTFCDNLDASGTFDGTVNVVPTPEPASALYLLLGIFCVLSILYQRKG